MTFYSKLIAAVIGMLVLIASRYGLDLSGMEQLLTEAAIGLMTAIAVYLAKNKPANEDQRAVALQTAQEASKTSET